MTDIAITPANVLKGSDALTKNGVAGEAVTAGQVVYKSQDDNLWYLADANSATEGVRKATAIALNGAAASQPVTVLTYGDVTIGGTLVAGLSYYLSATAGGIAPYADLTTGDYVMLLGVSSSTTVLHFDPTYSGVAL